MRAPKADMLVCKNTLLEKTTFLRRRLISKPTLGLLTSGALYTL